MSIEILRMFAIFFIQVYWQPNTYPPWHARARRHGAGEARVSRRASTFPEFAGKYSRGGFPFSR